MTAFGSVHTIVIVKDRAFFGRPQLSLKIGVAELEFISDEHHVYLDKRSGEFVSLTDEDLRDVESDESFDHYPDWHKELTAQAKEVLGSDHYIELPSKFDIHEYQIMEQFIYSIESEELSDRLLREIRGRGAFRRFKDMAFRYGIECDWYRFRAQALEKIAIEWLEDNGIPWCRGTDE